MVRSLWTEWYPMASHGTTSALTVSDVLSNAETSSMLIKQFIYTHLQKCISASDNNHGLVSWISGQIN